MIQEGVDHAASSTGAECIRAEWQEALAASKVLEALRGLEVRLVGTLPLGVDVATSDIDVVVHSEDPNEVAERLAFPGLPFDELKLWRWCRAPRPLVAAFNFGEWPFEVFASPQPITQQDAWRHFEVERRLLVLGGVEMRDAVRTRRLEGLKTEAAFAELLGLAGDPYEAISGLFAKNDDVLLALINRRST
jgi:hypothetical protein